jgi:carboxyl-terminal processing protease
MISREQVGSLDDKQYQYALEILNKKLLIAESLKKSN